MRHKSVVLLCSLFFIQLAYGADNVQLSLLYRADQAARQKENVNWNLLKSKDEERRMAVLLMIKNGEITTATDYSNAAMIFHHGDSEGEIRLAHSLAVIGSAIDPTDTNLNWMKAASWDRLLISFNQPQWYATQLVRDENGRFELYQVNEDVITDDERIYWSVLTLKEAKERANSLNNE